jgi:signal transduction histidine kinase/CheY-like chemotaxis protein
MENKEKIVSQAIEFQWDIYERFLNIYSILLKLIELFEKKERVIEEIPQILVLGTNFDTCYAVLFDEQERREGFFSLVVKDPDMDLQKIVKLNRGSLSPSTFFDTPEYAMLYVHPLVSDFEIKGFIVLGKKDLQEEEKIGIKEIEIILGIFNRLLSFSPFGEIDLTRYLPYALLLLDSKGTILYSNEKAKEMLSQFSRILEGRKIDTIFLGFDNSLLLEDEPSLGEVSFKTREGYKTYELEIYPVKDKKGKTVLKGIIVRDVSLIKAMEEESLYREKMEALGMLSAGIAHDFNNLLTGILGYASILKGQLSKEERIVKQLEVIERSATRASNLVKHLLNFSRRQKRPSMQFDLHVILDDTLFLFGESFRGIEVKRKFEPTQFLIRGDDSEFQHVFLNLFMNAKDAMEGSGVLSVETRSITLGEKEYVRVTVEDTGRGIDERVLEKLFKPHFTTKSFGPHLGLGLFRVEKTVKKYGGFLEVETDKGKGTKFYVYIPISSKSRERQAETIRSTNEEKPKPQRKSILVVDDEDFICDMFRHALSANFEVICCTNGEEALKEMEKREFHMVILDIIMPGMKGDEVLRRIRETKKDVKVVISSGYMREDQRERIKRLKVEAFLDKPFTEGDILDIVRKVLEEKKD